MKYYIKGDYYFDIDLKNQLRITGPENHLLLGLTVPENYPIQIESYDVIDEQLSIELTIPTDKLSLAIPLVTDIRTLRHHIESKRPQPKYHDLVHEGVAELLPRHRQHISITGATVLSFTNTYTDLNGMENKYGAEILLPHEYEVDLREKSIAISSNTKSIQLLVYSVSTIVSETRFEEPVFTEVHDLPEDLFSQFLLDLYHESKENIEHLIKSKKTSSFEYGTIFPRDWIESADLGKDDLSIDTIDHMYEQSMKYVSESGEGWHEEVIGEYRVKLQGKDTIIDRKMIDIEPHYILGVPLVSKRFLFNEENHDKLKRIANYVVEQARTKNLITFKRRNPESDDFYLVGNWRDSTEAFPQQKSPLAPYDVNCVFYPEALKIILKYHEYFEVENLTEMEELIEKWQRNKVKFRLYHPDQIIGYSLALHGRKNIPLPTAHLDESYDLFYHNSNFEEITSFAKKIIDPDFFYTPVGPMLVASDETYFTTKQYHGKVIWPKQAAYAVVGMAKHYRIGINEQWPRYILKILSDAIIKTCEACFRGWTEIQCVPELYYYDDEEEDRARLYTDQDDYEGQMSLIQLWSSVGCRRIMQEYSFTLQTPVPLS